MTEPAIPTVDLADLAPDAGPEARARALNAVREGFATFGLVLVIIGLLLGGVLKGQELINSAKAKSYAQDFRTIQAALYGFQDRFKGIPGDLAGADTKINLATLASASGLTVAGSTTAVLPTPRRAAPMFPFGIKGISGDPV